MHPAVPAGWLPASPCGPACLVGPDNVRSSRVRSVTRIVTVAAALLAATAAVFLPAPAAWWWLGRCCRAVLFAAGVWVRGRRV